MRIWGGNETASVSKRMTPIGQQPLFQLLGAIIVLLTADWNPGWGIVAGLVWIAWVSSSATSTQRTPSQNTWM
jgi:hypothetical protein